MAQVHSNLNPRPGPGSTNKSFSLFLSARIPACSRRPGEPGLQFETIMKLMKHLLNSSNPEMAKANYRPLAPGFCVLALPLSVLNVVDKKCSGLQESRLPANHFYLMDFLMNQYPSLHLSPFQCDESQDLDALSCGASRWGSKDFTRLLARPGTPDTRLVTYFYAKHWAAEGLFWG